jgi:hypothetical protein
VTLIDAFMPRWDVIERHHTTVRASAERVYAAIAEANLGGGALVALLVGLRSLPAAIMRGGPGLRALMNTPPFTLESLERAGFRVLERDPPREIVLGIEGQFWQLSGGRCTPDVAAFRTDAPAPGMARGIWNFTVVPEASGRVRLSTETRVLCADTATRRRFLPYWTVIRPGSGLIRRSMLASITQVAEEGP